MKNGPLVAVATILTTAFALPVSAAEGDLCGDVLRGGVFNTTEFKDNIQNKESFTAFQCSTNFGSHDEALAAGLTVGTVVYGAPLNVGGNWSQNEKSAWFSENCSAASRKIDFRTSTHIFLRTEAPAVLAAWTTCMTANYQPVVLQCRLVPAGARFVFSALWRRAAGEPVNAAPIVSAWDVHGGKCERPLARKTVINEGGEQTACIADEDEALVVLLSTQRGSCSMVAEQSKTVEVLTGKVVLASDRHVKADVINITADARIVTDGHNLTLEAREINVSGSPRIIAFEPRPGRPLGERGRSTGDIRISAKRLSGTALTIENFGENGMKGEKGATGPRGPKGAQGQQHQYNVFRGCWGRTASSNGGPGGIGGRGGTGGAGGNAGSIIYSIEQGLSEGAISRLIFAPQLELSGAPASDACKGSCGGRGGPPGDGGDGGEGGAGGDAVPGTMNCGGSPPGNPGPRGPTGIEGVRGNDGADGSIVDVRAFARQ